MASGMLGCARFANLKSHRYRRATMDRRRLSLVFLALAVIFFLADLITPDSSFPGLGAAGAVLYWTLYVVSLLFIVLFAAFRGRSY